MYENMFNVGEVTELLFNAKFAHLLEGNNYANVSEELHNARYSHLLEGHTYSAASELWFAARN